MLRWGQVLCFDQNGGCHVTKDKVAVTIAPVEMARCDFGIYDQYRTCVAA
eukprot:gene589-823_t